MRNSHKTPFGWKRIKLGEYLAELSERNDTSGDNGTPVLSVTNRPGFSMSEEHFDKKVFSKDLSNYKIVQQGQFAYNPSRVNVGSIARLKEFKKGLLSPMYIIFEAKGGLDGAYLDHWILSLRFRNLVKASTQGSVRNSLNFSFLADFPFDLPPEHEQKQIISVLDGIDSVIAQTQAVVNQIEVVKKGLKRDLFVGGMPGKHKEFRKTSVGQIPKTWDVVRINDVGEIITGTTPSTKRPDYYGVACPWATPGDLGTEKYIQVTKKYLSKKGLTVARAVPKGSILIVCIGSTIGKVGIATQDMTTNQQINSIVCNDEWDYRYVFHLMDKLSSLFKLMAGRQAVPIISKKVLAAFYIPKPPKEEQELIGMSLDLMDENIIKEKEGISFLKHLKASLAQALLTGEVRVKT